MGKNSGKNYDGRCSHLTEEDVARQKKAGHKHVVRFKVSTTVECNHVLLLIRERSGNTECGTTAGSDLWSSQRIGFRG